MSYSISAVLESVYLSLTPTLATNRSKRTLPSVAKTNLKATTQKVLGSVPKLLHNLESDIYEKKGV